MKKSWMIALLTALALAGALLTGCSPSEAEEGKDIEDYDFILEGGKYQFNFDDPGIVHGNEYEVIFTITDCSESFLGSRLGGKICYKTDLTSNDEKVLSGWDIAVPPTVSANTHSYKWTFKAGEANSDNVTIENPATTPSGGKQYFSFTAQDGFTNYPANVSFKIKGGFEVVSLAPITSWISEGEITLGDLDGTVGKGTLSDADMAKIRGMPARSEIEFTVNVTVGSNGANPGFGVCGVGGWQDDNSKSIPVPNDASNGDLTFTARLKIADILALPFAGNININPYNGATVIKAELFKPGN